MNAVSRTLLRHHPFFFPRCIGSKLRAFRDLSSIPSYTISGLFKGDHIEGGHKTVRVSGWVKQARKHKNVTFLQLNDGSAASNLQIVLPDNLSTTQCTFGSCVQVTGSVVECPDRAQNVELSADGITPIGECDPHEFPFKAKKMHPPDYVRQYLHLRPKTNFFGNLLRVRNDASQAIHGYFQENGFCEIQTPILTSNDCEGAGETFQVEASIQAQQTMKNSGNKDDGNGEFFFNVPTYLTVSGQLHLEVIAGGLSKVYNFSPVFRAENSRGRHHLSEFTMIEAEMAFVESQCDLQKVIEGLLKTCTEKLLLTRNDEISWFRKHVSSEDNNDHIDTLLNKDFKTLTYAEAMDILKSSSDRFAKPVSLGMDLQKEHEKFLVKHSNNIPVFLTDFPSKLKPFYMKQNSDTSTVAALDLLVPGVGELCGGSIREDNYQKLSESLKEIGLSDSLHWYLDLRKYGSTPHGGFGLGFERYIQFMLGIPNIKDSLPFPRSTHNCQM